MTREAKIGMLTGLGVIVLIGVLLSSYLGDKPGTPGAVASSGNGPTGQMADLGIGESYRQQVMQPVGVPAMASQGVRTVTLPGGGEIASPVDGSDRSMPPAAFAVESSQVPVPVAAVKPVPAGPAVASVAADRGDDPPTISLAQSATVQVKATEAPKPTSPTEVTYIVASGDSLGKIAKKFYNSSKTSDVQRIVAANPGSLKDASTMLVVGKKLTIPGVVPAAAVVTLEERPATVYAPGTLPKPGPVTENTRKVQPPTGVAATAAAAPKTSVYVVQSGDTLEKISKRIAPSKVNDTVQKLISLNSIKDPSNLKVGTKLKVPA
jgi:LysM repeat protein